MEPVARVVKVSLPNYLSELPIPSTFGGWFRLRARDWLSIIPFGVVVAGLSYATYQAFCPAAFRRRKINPSVKKDVSKVVDSFEIEDMGDKVSFCRCWRSKEFPFCDGSHNAFNKETGDNVGPLCVKKRSGEA